MFKFLVYGEKDKHLDTVTATMMEVDRGCLVFRNESGRVIKAFAPGAWQEAYRDVSQSIHDYREADDLPHPYFVDGSKRE